MTASICVCGHIAGYEWADWKLVVIWLSHGLQDHFRLGTVWMNLYKQFDYFNRNMPQAYVWATIVVDNVWHLLLLFVLYHI